MKNSEEVIKYLKMYSDEEYKKFSKKITPGKFEMVGVRIPDLKRIIKILTNEEKNIILKINNSSIFEIIMLKGLIIANIKDIELYKIQFENFYPLINNWAICDTFLSASKIIKKDKEYFFEKSKELLKTKDEFKNRVAFVILLNYFIEDNYIEKIYDLIKNYKSNDYYANMALAWLISCLYIKYPNQTQQFLLKSKLDNEVIKMTNRKIRDSYRVKNEDKDWIKKTINFS